MNQKQPHESHPYSRSFQKKINLFFRLVVYSTMVSYAAALIMLSVCSLSWFEKKYRQFSYDIFDSFVLGVIAMFLLLSVCSAIYLCFWCHARRLSKGGQRERC